MNDNANNISLRPFNYVAGIPLWAGSHPINVLPGAAIQDEAGLNITDETGANLQAD